MEFVDFDEEKHNKVILKKQILYSIVSGFPSGISDLELKNESLNHRYLYEGSPM